MFNNGMFSCELQGAELFDNKIVHLKVNHVESVEWICREENRHYLGSKNGKLVIRNFGLHREFNEEEEFSLIGQGWPDWKLNIKCFKNRLPSVTIVDKRGQDILMND